MEIIVSAADMQGRVRDAARRSERVGFVPTMGWLHAGHLSLVAAARRRSERVVLSVFVNPTQFGPGEDFAAYPRDLERDAKLASDAGVDWLFAPGVEQMYPPGSRTFVEVGGLGELLCGRSRPGHFRGVATVVAKLLAVVDPDAAFFGEKDFQQLTIVRRMAGDLLLRCAIVGCPIVRDDDGVALSSRNRYLSPSERSAAIVLPRALARLRAEVAAGERSTTTLLGSLRRAIAEQPLVRLDYAEVVDPESLEAVPAIGSKALAAVAMFVGKTRLIDNEMLVVGESEERAKAC